MKYIYVQMDRDIYRFPAHVVADIRAKYYASWDKDTTYEKEYEFTMSDDSELFNWMNNQMNWEDVKEHAEFVKIEPRNMNYDKLWMEKDCWCQDE